MTKTGDQHKNQRNVCGFKATLFELREKRENNQRHRINTGHDNNIFKCPEDERNHWWTQQHTQQQSWQSTRLKYHNVHKGTTNNITCQLNILYIFHISYTVKYFCSVTFRLELKQAHLTVYVIIHLFNLCFIDFKNTCWFYFFYFKPIYDKYDS